MNRVLTFLVAILALGAARNAFAADACITEDAKKAINTCPNSGPQSFNVAGHGKAPVVSFHAPPPVKQNALTQTKPTNPSEQMAAGQRDDRKSRLQQRALALLITEIQQLEQLNKATEANSKDRVGILRRLAEDYVELENAAFREKTQSEVDRDEAKKKGNSRLAGEKQAVANSRTKTLDGAR
jgi:hypothetical protein